MATGACSNPAGRSICTIIILLTIFLILSVSLTQRERLSARVVQRRDRSIPTIQYYPVACNVPDIPCLCTGPTSGSGDYIVYARISCFLNEQWNVTVGTIPRTRSLLLSCHHQGNGTEEPADLQDNIFNKFGNALEELKMMGCKIGILPTDIFKGLTFLQRLLLISVDLNGRRLSAIGGIKTNASIKLTSNYLSILNSESFGNFTSNVSTLDLSYNEIQEIRSNTFVMFPSLQKLFLGNNNISNVQEDAFIGLQELSVLNINNNPNLFQNNLCILENVPTLTTLDLSFTGLTNTTEFNCAILGHLETLLINGNHLKQLGDSVFTSMRNIMLIDVSYNDLENVHNGAFNGGLNDLKHVDMSCNRLKDFPAFVFESTPNIKSINNSHNYLSVIKKGTFSGLASLQTIDLSFNRLYSIEIFAFVNLDNLTLIDLRHNQFAIFPDDLIWPFDILPPHIPITALLEGNSFICGCPYMFFIRRGEFENTYPFFLLPDNTTWTCQAPPPVANKSVMTLPLQDFWCPFEGETCREALCDCYKRDIDKSSIFFCRNHTLHSLPNFPVKTLIFECNGCLIEDLVTLRPGALQASSRLAVLVLQNIGLQSVLPGALQAFPNLQELDVSYNVLNAFNDDILTNLTRLQTVDLSKNRITSLSSQTFSTNLNLTTINIHSNSLETLEDGVFNSTADLSVLTLHDNPFICNCSLFWLKTWLQSHLDFVPRLYDVTCYVNSSDHDMYPVIQVPDHDFGCYTPDVHTLTVEEYNAVIISSTLTVLLVLIGAVTFRHRRALRIILYTRYGFHVFHGDDEDDIVVEGVRREFDAYIAYSDEDIEYVLQNIIPILEEDGDRHFKLCIRHRDFPPGGCIATTIVSSVESSRRTIILLSRRFLQDEWRLLEFKTAHQRVLQDKRNKNLILVFLDDLAKDEMDEDMRYYVTANAYLSSRDRLFRETLLYEMPMYPLADIHGEIEDER